MKKNKALVFTLTSDLAFAVACVMLDIKRISPKLADEIVIIHDGISKKDQYILNSILPTRFISYNFPIKYYFSVHKEVFLYFTKMVFAKFECLRLLDDYKNVLLLDYDILIQQDISELFDVCDSGLKMLPGGLKVSGQLHELTSDYDMDAEGVCASTFVFQDHLYDYMKMYRFCYNCLIRYGKILYMPEQAIFDFMIQEFNLKNNPIDPKVYTPHPNDKEIVENVKIFHAYGQPKFWNGLDNQQWNINYLSWMQMGGSEYKKITMKKKFQRFMHVVNSKLG